MNTNDSCEYPRCMVAGTGGTCPRAAACRPQSGPRYMLVECPPLPDDTGHCAGEGAPPPCEPAVPVDACGSPCPNPKRPERPAGHDSGRLADPTPLTKGDLDNPRPPGVWAGPRKEMPLPYLLIRAHPGDLGARPVAGPFWESPDIFILPGVSPSAAPAIPKSFGSVAIANQPNTLYAHVWNFGHGAASEALVEFYWCDPSLGINAASAHLIAQTPVTLGSKGSGRSHAVVKCPVAWRPTFLNGGHECLVVRVWDNPSDMLGVPGFDAASNRHVAQRNIHVVTTGAGATKARAAIVPRAVEPGAAALATPLILKIGPLFQAPAQITVERVAAHNMPWLQLHTGERGRFPLTAVPTGAALLSSPFAAGSGISMTGLGARHCVSGEDQAVAFTTSDAAPAKGEAHVYRISATQGGVLFGGYTVVVVGQ